MRTIQLAVACMAVLVATAGQVQAGIINTNGDFETGLAGWTVTGGSSLNGIATTGSPTGNNNTSIFTNFPAAPTGDNFAYQTWNAGNAYQLTQNFVVPAASTYALSFDVIWDYNGEGGWEYLGPVLLTDQTLVVDIVLNGTPFTNISVANVVATGLAVGTGGEPFDSGGWRSYNVDVTGNLAPLVGQTLTLRYVGAVTHSFSTFAVDNLFLDATSTAAVPEPSSLALFGIGACVAGVGAASRRRREKFQEATA
ncbi:PEP-CTERM motif protein [Roseimaritima multifibrata]|uniref:PEP-CTERM motif protein n=1 Tax=Roseimaritima multifibrata TaxID=1930274 RepID=A0A517MH58_9BACT|nr:PEP-CTERM sorting domain-containing protein [Roseimaritima multifibrata]QDS94216.1 PEP-CTERM motif protein [Roseimaritima multifibrata]